MSALWDSEKRPCKDCGNCEIYDIGMPRAKCLKFDFPVCLESKAIFEKSEGTCFEKRTVPTRKVD